MRRSGVTLRDDARYPIRSRLFHLICTEPEPRELLAGVEEAHREALAQDERFFSRLPDLGLQGCSVLDYGCGQGSTSIAMAKRGARRVLGVDIQSVEDARALLEGSGPELRDRVELRQISSAQEIDGERFDFVISKNTFEHVADPDRYVRDMATLLAPGGWLVIGFSPLWKSPYGGHFDFMTKVPWSHLMFPEAVILRERKRYRPEEDPACFEEVRGGLNRMTLAGFTAIMGRAELEPCYFEVNNNDRAIARLLGLFSKLPGLGEYFTYSIHSVWRHRGGEHAADR
jgi:SAM-dependent methyltransferase